MPSMDLWKSSTVISNRHGCLIAQPMVESCVVTGLRSYHFQTAATIHVHIIAYTHISSSTFMTKSFRPSATAPNLNFEFTPIKLIITPTPWGSGAIATHYAVPGLFVFQTTSNVGLILQYDVDVTRTTCGPLTVRDSCPASRSTELVHRFIIDLHLDLHACLQNLTTCNTDTQPRKAEGVGVGRLGFLEGLDVQWRNKTYFLWRPSTKCRRCRCFVVPGPGPFP